MPEPIGAVNLTNCRALAILALCFTSSALAQPGFGGRGFGGPGGRGGPGGMSQRPSLSLKSFFEQRRAFLLNYAGIASLARAQ